MGKINVLEDSVINKIAAGEVVERPASVLKELVENSLDAEATRIEIEVLNGGLKKIIVSDNGTGMEAEDLRKSIERHATSKITCMDDLYKIASLGFRGEALPSIASVSRMDILSSAGKTGSRLTVEGGKKLKVVEAGAPRGTTITIADLFFNTPARLKFMRSERTESGHVIQAFTRLALSRKDVFFSLSADGKRLYTLPGSQDELDRASALLGGEFARNAMEFSEESSLLSLGGFITGPSAAKSTSREIYFYLNGRFVRDYLMTKAITDAFRRCAEPGKYPSAIIRMAIDPAAVDVNVHPMKMEVRFRDPNGVFSFVRNSIEKALSRPPKPVSSPGGAKEAPVTYQSTLADTGARDSRIREAISDYMSRQDGKGKGPFIPAKQQPHRAPEQAEIGGAGTFSKLSVLGTTGERYIVCRSSDGVVFIDQHAAHERINFEKLRKAFKERKRARQGLLIGQVIELPASQAAHLTGRLEWLGAFGLEIEEFGKNSFALKSIPEFLKTSDADSLIRDIAEEISEFGNSMGKDEAVDRVAARLACHASVRKADRLSVADMVELLNELDRTEFSGTCPHGRPTYIQMTLNELDKRFGRK